MQSGLLHLKVDHLWKQTQIRLDAVPVLRLPKASLIQIIFSEYYCGLKQRFVSQTYYTTSSHRFSLEEGRN